MKIQPWLENLIVWNKCGKFNSVEIPCMSTTSIIDWVLTPLLHTIIIIYTQTMFLINCDQHKLSAYSKFKVSVFTVWTLHFHTMKYFFILRDLGSAGRNKFIFISKEMKTGTQWIHYFWLFHFGNHTLARGDGNLSRSFTSLLYYENAYPLLLFHSLCQSFCILHRSRILGSLLIRNILSKRLLFQVVIVCLADLENLKNKIHKIVVGGQRWCHVENMAITICVFIIQ